MSASSLARFRWIYIVLLTGWLGMVVLFSVQEQRIAREMTVKMVHEQARTLLVKDIVYRHWNSSHGGVYVPITESTPPNPYLAHLPNRDVVTEDGQRLTLINPAYMTRQVHELQHEETKAVGRLTSLTPLNPANASDLWEEAALERCAAGETEVSAIVENEGQPFLRLMRPMVIVEGCLDCHASQGYKVGDVKGGISVTVPMAPYFAAQSGKRSTEMAVHALLALVGATFITLGYLWIRRNEINRLQDETNILRLSMAVEQSPASVVITDTTGNIEYINPKFSAVTGYNQDEAIGRNPRILKSGAHGPDFYTSLWNTISRGGVWRGEFMNLKKSGEAYWESASISPIKDASGQIINFVAVKEDITEKKAFQQALIKQKEFVETVLNSIPEAISIIDIRDFTIQGANAAFLEEVGRSLDQVLGQPCYLITHGRNEKCAGDYHPCPLVNPGRWDMPAIMEHQHQGPGGEQTFYEISVFPLKDETGKFNRAVHLSRDITERKLFEQTLESSRQQAEQANRAKSEFLANLSHEFRTPMNGIIGMTDLVLDTELTSDQREYLALARQAADALLRLLNDTLDFSKIEAGKLDLDMTPFNLRGNLAEAVYSMSYQADQKGIDLKLTIDPETPKNVVGDPGRLRQVLLNLLSNALKFTEQGEVDVSVRPLAVTDLSLELLFSVSDTGIGIPPKHQPHIFEAFTQADGSITRKFGGTGLGLAICQRLVAMFGGRIWVESRENQGSRFSFTAFFGTADESAPHLDILPDERLRGMNALIVDDDEENRMKINAILRNSGLQTREAMGEPSAIKAVKQAIEKGCTPELILLDADLSVAKGCEMVARLRRDFQELKDTLLIIMTSDLKNMNAKTCRQIGIDGFLAKPVQSSDLLKLIRQVLASAPPAFSFSGTSPAIGQAPAQGAPLKILVAEDNLINQKLTERLLEKAGHRVVLASDGLEAVAAANRELFDLVFMDIQMPRMDGMAAARQIRETDQAAGRHTPIVALTAHALKGDREKFLNNGFDAYLAKPVNYQAILELLEMIHSTGSGLSDIQPSIANLKDNQDSDLINLLAKVGGDLDLVREMVEIFIDELPDRLREIESALLNNQPEKLENAAHRLKGSIGYFSVGGAFESNKTLIEMARRNNIDEAPAVFHRLKDELRHLEISLTEWLEDSGSN